MCAESMDLSFEIRPTNSKPRGVDVDPDEQTYNVRVGATDGDQSASKVDHLYQALHVDVVASSGTMLDLISSTQGDCYKHLVRYPADWIAKCFGDAAHQELFDVEHAGKGLSFNAPGCDIELIAHA